MEYINKTGLISFVMTTTPVSHMTVVDWLLSPSKLALDLLSRTSSSCSKVSYLLWVVILSFTQDVIQQIKARSYTLPPTPIWSPHILH